MLRAEFNNVFGLAKLDNEVKLPYLDKSVLSYNLGTGVTDKR